MIDYSPGYWGVTLIFRIRGSVFPKALIWAVPAGALAILTEYLYYVVFNFDELEHASKFTLIWSSFTFVLGFLVVFRTQQAFNRYWEGAMLLRQARGEWFSAYSSSIAFCTSSKERRDEVEAWQHTLARLFSMLNSLALETVADMENPCFEHLDPRGFDIDRLTFLASKSDAYIRMEIVVQWVQKHIVHGIEKGVLTMPPPILSRAFQELSRGAVNFNQLRNFTEIPFPFPYAQLLSVMLIFFTVITPILAGVVLRSSGWGVMISFLGVLAFWGINYIAAEIESPFGEDANDLPLKTMQQDINSSLWQLLDRRAQSPPAFAFDTNSHRTASITNSSRTFTFESEKAGDIRLNSIRGFDSVRAGPNEFSSEQSENLRPPASAYSLQAEASSKLDIETSASPRVSEVGDEIHKCAEAPACKSVSTSIPVNPELSESAAKSSSSIICGGTDLESYTSHAGGSFVLTTAVQDISETRPVARVQERSLEVTMQQRHTFMPAWMNNKQAMMEQSVITGGEDFVFNTGADSACYMSGCSSISDNARNGQLGPVCGATAHVVGRERTEATAMLYPQ